jgi:RNA polymerase sigma-54 factor
MKPALQLRLSQHLALTPQLQQSIKLLQLSTLELNQELERYLLENPLLERDGDDDEPAAPPLGEAREVVASTLEAGPTEPREESGQSEAAERETSDATNEPYEEDWRDDGGSYSSSGGRDDEDDSDFQEVQAAATSLRDHLCWQLGLTPLPDRDRSLVRLLIEALDDDGYLATSLEEIAESFPEDFELEPEELQIALNHLQHFDPTGVGARDARECLQLQLLALPVGDCRDLAVRIVREGLDLLANRDFAKLKRLLGCDDDALRQAHALIRGLNPRPGAQFAAVDTRYIVPDVIVRKLRGQWVANINPDAFPKLRINRLYAEILSRQRRGENGNLSGQLQEARWLIKNVQQRFDTIQRVTQAIVDRQRQFFEHGEVAMRPLVLREIADILGLHESTISRVTTQKYMATPRGIFELKYFFGSHVATEAGGACSATAIRALIKQLVGAENGKKPLSDSQISDILGQQGIVVARRTIAKYREALGIPPANLRKSL